MTLDHRVHLSKTGNNILSARNGELLRGVVLRCNDSTTKEVDIDVLRNSFGNFEEIFDRDRVELRETFDVDYSCFVMDTVLDYDQHRKKSRHFGVSQVIHLLSAAHKFGVFDLMEDIKEFVIANPSSCFESDEFLRFHTVEDVALLKSIFSDPRFTGRLMLYQRICEWKLRMIARGVGNSRFSLLDREFYEKLVDKDILVHLEKIYDPLNYSERFGRFSESVLDIFTRLETKLKGGCTARFVPDRKID